jgi:transcriptional regulator with XRE-family HTH domain
VVEFVETLDRLIRSSRERVGLTQQELATELKTTVSRISRLERGVEVISLQKAARIAKFLQLDVRAVVTSLLQSLVARDGLGFAVRLAVPPGKRRARTGEEIARLRYAAGLSVRDVARRAKMLPSRVAKVENDGELVLHVGTAARFADALGVERALLVELALQDYTDKHMAGVYRVKVK